MKFSSIVTFMARGPLRWRLWLAIGVLPTLALFAFDALTSVLVHLHAMWKWEWKDQLVEASNAFSEKYRLSLLSLGRKPEAGGVVWRYKDME